MIAFTIALLLASAVSGLPAPRPEADPEPLPLPLPVADPEPAPVPEPEANPEADPEADPNRGLYGGYGGYGGVYPYGGVVEEVLPPIIIEGCYEEVIVGPEYPGIHALRG